MAGQPWVELASRASDGDQLPAALSDGLLEHLARLSVRAPQGDGPSATCVGCVVGPAVSRPEVLDDMLRAGLRLVLFDTAAGSPQEHSTGMMMVRAAAARVTQSTGSPISVVIGLDLQGKAVRTGALTDGQATLREGAEVVLSGDDAYAYDGDADMMYVDMEDFADAVKPGDAVVLDDGLVRMRVSQVDEGNVRCVVEAGGVVRDRRRVSVPGKELRRSTETRLTEGDLRSLRLAVEESVDFVLTPGVSDAAGVVAVRDELHAGGEHKMLVLAKIETAEGVENAADIAAAADGVVLDRAALGANMPPEKVFLAQKSVAARCVSLGKPVLCCVAAAASRADLCDLATAVLDGADALVLGPETTAHSVATAARVCREAEAAAWTRRLLAELLFETPTPAPADPTLATGAAATLLALQARASAVVVLTVTGAAARQICRFRPRCSVVAVTRNFDVARKLSLHRGVLPLAYVRPQHDDWGIDTDLRFQYAIVEAKKRGCMQNGDAVVLVSGWRPGTGNTNKARLMYS